MPDCLALGWDFALDGGGLAAGAFCGDFAHLAADAGLVHDELGGDGDEVADGPVKGEAGGVVPGHVAGEGGHHEGHHLLLLRVYAGGWGVELHEELAEHHDDGEDMVRVGGGEVGEPVPVSLAKLDNLGEHAEEGEEERELDEGGDTAAEHVDPVVLLELHDFDVHLVALGVGGLVLLVALLDDVHLGLDALHFEAGLHGLDAQGENDEVNDDGEDDDGPAPAGGDVGVDELEGEEEVLADDAEEAEVDEGLQGGLAAGGGDGLEDFYCLGTGVDAGAGVAGEVADGCAEDGDEYGVLGFGGDALTEAVVAGGFVDVHLVVQGGDGGGVGGVREEDGGEVHIADAGPVKGAVEGSATGDFLGFEMFLLAVLEGVDDGVGVGGGHLLIAEAAGPAYEGADGGAVAEDLDVGVEDVGLIKGEGLGGLDGAVGVFEGERGRGGEGSGGRGDEHGLAKAGGEGLVVGIEGKGIAVLLGGHLVDEVEGLAFAVLVLLEEPLGDLAAAVGEGDLIELVLDDGGGFGGGLNGSGGGGGGRGGCSGGESHYGDGRCRGGGGRGLGDGRVGRCGLGVLAGLVVLKAEEDGDHDKHHDEEGLVVAAALLGGIFELCQERLPIWVGLDASEALRAETAGVRQPPSFMINGLGDWGWSLGLGGFDAWTGTGGEVRCGSRARRGRGLGSVRSIKSPNAGSRLRDESLPRSRLLGVNPSVIPKRLVQARNLPPQPSD